MNLSVVIPAHNEERTIGWLVHSVKKRGFDVVVVDDGSTDRTRFIAEAGGAQVLHNEVKRGKGGSVKRGFEKVLEDPGATGVILMDGDGQHHPDDLEAFLGQIEKNPISVISGNRFENAKGMPFVRFCTNKFMSWLISLACGQRVPDTQCGYRYISAEILKNIELTCNDFEFETEILMKASKKGYPIFSVPVQTIYSDEKSKIRPGKDTIRFFKYFFKEVFNR